MLKNIILLSVIACSLLACASEPVYRNVPEATWVQLTTEQKQLIIDNDFQQKIQPSVGADKKGKNYGEN